MPGTKNVQISEKNGIVPPWPQHTYTVRLKQLIVHVLCPAIHRGEGMGEGGGEVGDQNSSIRNPSFSATTSYPLHNKSSVGGNFFASLRA